MLGASQSIRFCTSADGTRIAWTEHGSGPVLVKTSGFLSHLEHEPFSPVWRPWLEQLSRGRRLLRLDARGCGLSDREVTDLSLRAAVDDLEAVVAAARVSRFAIYGHSQGAAVAIAYAVRHPDQVSGLVLVGGFARGLNRSNPGAGRIDQARAMLRLVELGWGQDNPAFRQMFTSLFIPGGTPQQIGWFNDLQRISTTPQVAARILAETLDVDLSDLAPQVRCPTLVMHSVHDARIPFEQGRLLASLIPEARLVPIDSRNHIVLAHEPAWDGFFLEMDRFLHGLASQEITSDPAFGTLTPRERQVLEMIAAGLDNRAISKRLQLSEKTVRNHITAIFAKLAVPTRAQAIVRAREAGIGLQVSAAAPVATGGRAGVPVLPQK